MAINLEDILAQTTQANAQSAQATQEILGTYGEMKNVSEGRATNIQKKAASDTLVMETLELGKLQAQQNSRTAATSLGTNMDDLGQIVTTLGADMKNSYAEAKAKLDKVSQLRGANFFGNPLGFIANQMALPGAIDDYNSSAEKFNLAFSTNQALQAATQSTATTQAAIAETTSAATIQAKADGIAAAASDQAAQLKLENLKYNILGVQAVEEMSGRQLERNFRAFSAVEEARARAFSQQMQLDGRELQKTQLGLQQQSLALSIQERTDRMAQAQLNRQEEIELAGTINTGRATLGLPPIPERKALQLMRIGGEMGASVRDAFKIGAFTESAGVPVIASDPATAGRVVLQSGAPLAPSMKPVKDLVTGIYSSAKSGQLAQQDASFRMLDTKNEPAVIEATNKVIAGTVTRMRKEIKPGDATNIYAAPPLTSLVTLKALQEQPFITKVLSPAVTAGMVEADPAKVMGLAMSSFSKGEITYNEAISGVAALYKAATIQNNVTRGYSRFGLPNQTNFPAKVAPQGFTQYPGMTYKDTFDLTNETDIGTYISKSQSNRLINTLRLMNGN